MSFLYPVVMPKMSMTMETGDLIVYYVSPGDHVKSGQVLFEVMTDKIDMEVEAPADGVIKDLIGVVGETIPIGKPVLTMLTETEVMAFDFDGPSEPMAEVVAQPVVEPHEVAEVVLTTPEPEYVPPVVEAPVVVEPLVVAPTATTQIKAVPKARALAAEKGISLSTIKATGPDGTIMFSDISGLQINPKIAARQEANRKLIAAGIEKTRSVPQTSFTRIFKHSSGKNQHWQAHLLTTWAGVLRSRLDLNISSINGEAGSDIGIAMIIKSIYGSALPVFHNPDLLGRKELEELYDRTTHQAQEGKVPIYMLSGATTTIFDLTSFRMSSNTPPLFPGHVTSLTVGKNSDSKKSVSLTIDLRYCDFYDGAELLDHLIEGL